MRPSIRRDAGAARPSDATAGATMAGNNGQHDFIEFVCKPARRRAFQIRPEGASSLCAALNGNTSVTKVSC